MVIHYEPYIEHGEEYHPFCGTQSTENTECSQNWDSVSCERCLKLKSKAKIYVEQTEKIILNQMQGFVDFMNSEK